METSRGETDLMKKLILILSLAGTAVLTACAQLQTAFREEGADAGATSVEDRRPYPKSSSDLGLF